MTARERFEKVFWASGPRDERSRLGVDDFMARLSEEVTQRFARLTRLTVLAVPVRFAAPGRDGDDPLEEVPVHPICAACGGENCARQAWRAHLQELREHPEPHWHRCEKGSWCAVIPVTYHARCLAACKLVCAQSTAEFDFRQSVELLGVLVENFCVSQETLLAKYSAARSEAWLQRPGVLPMTRGVAPAEVRHPHVRRAVQCIHENLTGPAVNVSDIARRLGLNASYLAHLFSQELGIHMSRYILDRRLELAQALLRDTDWEIKRVAYESGFASRGWFSQAFRSYTGRSPGQYRRQNRGPGPPPSGRRSRSGSN